MLLESALITSTARPILALSELPLLDAVCHCSLTFATSSNRQWIPVAGQGKFVGTPVGLEAIVGDFDHSQTDDAMESSPAKKKRTNGASKSKASQKSKKGKGRAAASDDEEEDELEDDDDDDLDGESPRRSIAVRS